MSRARTLKRRARRAMWFLAITKGRAAHIVGYAITEVTWRRSLRRGLWLPYWNGAPLISQPMPEPSGRAAP